MIEKQRYFLDFAISSLLRRKWKNLSLALVYTAMVFLFTSVVFFADAIRKEAAAVLKETPEMVIQRNMAGRHDLIPMEYQSAIAEIRGVNDVQPRLWGYYYHQAAASSYTVTATRNFDLADDEAAIGNGVLRTWGTIRDKELYIRGYDGTPVVLKIKTVLTAETDLVAADLILITEAAFRRIFGVPAGFATDMVARIRNPKEALTIAQKVFVRLPDTRPVLKEDILRTYASIFDWRSGYIIVQLFGAMLAFLIFAWDKATGLTGEERTEIGILKALGWGTSDILLLKFQEGLFISLSAFLAGVAAAYVHVFFSRAPLFEHALKGWSVLYPSFKLHPDIDAFQLAAVFALTVVPYSIMTIIPAWKVSVTEPDAAMRNV
ncbi:ABC transporter permease [Desulfococcus sp.]|uniref:ABC transporter permease n=1 Tax=Desulfococcus sp. TaxID=2025834 RepID=UPI003592EAFF